MSEVKRKWWKEGVVYQIWPTSYKDSNGDGIGDIPGIISTLDYVRELGIDIIWLSPAYASPKKDMGYDISNYEDIDPQYGTLADAEALIQECHKRGMRLIFDLVVNHTSDQHAWFQESRSSKDNSKRDWYIWRPPRIAADGTRQPPNNWKSWFGGSVWQWDETTEEYYFHIFAKEQPDLNWENPETRKAIYQSAIKFWLDRGLDGFRIDTVNLYSKRTDFHDAPIKDPQSDYQFYPEGFHAGPRIHEFLQEMHTEAFASSDLMTVGELGSTPDRESLLQYVSARRNELDMGFQFDICYVDRDKTDPRAPRPFQLSEFKAAYSQVVDLASNPENDGWSPVFLENHDQPRSISRFTTSSDEYRVRAAKVLATLLCASSGTLFMYQGQEIGMRNLPSTWGPENYRDIDAINYISEMQQRGVPLDEIMSRIQCTARDHARQPIPWTKALPYAGFTASNATPWAPVDPEFKDGWNIEDQRGDPESVLSFWQEAIQLRKRYPGLFVYGTSQICGTGDEPVFVIKKEEVVGFEDGDPKDSGITFAANEEPLQHRKAFIVMNFSSETQAFELEKGMTIGPVLLGNVDKGQGSQRSLAPWEARVYLAT